MNKSGSQTSRDFSGSSSYQHNSLLAYLPQFPLHRSSVPHNFLRSLRQSTYPKPLPESLSLQTLSKVSLGQYHASLLSLRSKVRRRKHEQALLASASELSRYRERVKTSNPRKLQLSCFEGNLTQRRAAGAAQVSINLASDGMQTEDLDLLTCSKQERTPVPARLFDLTIIPIKRPVRRIRRVSVLRLL